jgi:predicted HicB family RNase H-like nuclease
MATVYMRDFPNDLHKRAKMQAVREETTLKEIVIRALTEYLERKGG